MADSPEVAEARKAVDTAIRNYIDVSTKERGEENVYVTGWATQAEYTSTQLLEEEQSRSRLITPKDQTTAESIGLFHLGLAVYDIRRY
jgi:hypothetical protein